MNDNWKDTIGIVNNVLQSPSSIKYKSSLRSPSPYTTNMNVYHDPETNTYVVEYPGSGSAWNIIDEATAKEIIEQSTIDNSHSEWVKNWFKN